MHRTLLLRLQHHMLINALARAWTASPVAFSILIAAAAFMLIYESAITYTAIAGCQRCAASVHDHAPACYAGWIMCCSLAGISAGGIGMRQLRALATSAWLTPLPWAGAVPQSRDVGRRRHLWHGIGHRPGNRWLGRRARHRRGTRGPGGGYGCVRLRRCARCRRMAGNGLAGHTPRGRTHRRRRRDMAPRPGRSRPANPCRALGDGRANPGHGFCLGDLPAGPCPIRGRCQPGPAQ